MSKGNSFNSLIQIIDYCTMKKQINAPKREYGGQIHLSEVTTCARQYMFKTMGFEKPLPTPQQDRVFSIGHFYHQQIQNMLVENGFCNPEDIERPITSEEYNLLSNADIATIWIGNLEYIVDIKTINHDKIKNVKCKLCGSEQQTVPSKGSFQSLKRKPKPEHVNQVTLYIYFINEIRKKNNQPLVRYGKILYINKAGGQYLMDEVPYDWKKEQPLLLEEHPDINIAPQHFEEDMKEYDFEFDEALAEELVEKVKRVSALIKSEVVPDINKKEVNSFYCQRFCNYYERFCKNIK